MQRPGETDAEYLERLCREPSTREEYVEEVDEMVAEDAPRVFAIVGELADLSDGAILAWGMQFEDTVLVHVPDKRTYELASVERALTVLGRAVKPHVSLRAVWADEATARFAA